MPADRGYGRHRVTAAWLPGLSRPAAGYPPPGYGPPGYGPPAAPALKPGVIPLRPLSLSDIFNGAVAYIRANPKATLGLTTIVVVVAQLLALVLSVGPLAVTGELPPSLSGEEVSPGVLLGSSASSLAGAACHLAVVHPAERHAHRRRRTGRLRHEHHHQ